MMSSTESFPVKSYTNSTEWPLSICVTVPTLFNAIGDITDCAILDVGCGFGRHTRRLVEGGAREYVGIDSSEQMIDMAREYNQGLERAEFEHLNALEMQFKDRFDLVLANFVLHFSPTKAALISVCKNIHAALKPGGRALGFVPNGIAGLKYSEDDGRKYGARLLLPESVHDEQDVQIIFHDAKSGEIAGTTMMKWYFKETYELCFKEAGFTNIDWISPEVSADGMTKYGRQYFDALVKPPKSLLFKLQKC